MYPSSFSTLRMASLSFEAPTPTVGLPADCALRMRVRRSAIGSVMLILGASPRRLGKARDFPAARSFAQLGARQAELAIHAARAAGDRAAIALAMRARIARLALQLGLGRGTPFRSPLGLSDQLS